MRNEDLEDDGRFIIGRRSMFGRAAALAFGGALALATPLDMTDLVIDSAIDKKRVTEEAQGEGHHEAISRHAHSLAERAASAFGGTWSVDIDGKDQFITIFRSAFA